jgi:hypothetical protein
VGVIDAGRKHEHAELGAGRVVRLGQPGGVAEEGVLGVG